MTSLTNNTGLLDTSTPCTMPNKTQMFLYPDFCKWQLHRLCFCWWPCPFPLSRDHIIQGTACPSSRNPTPFQRCEAVEGMEASEVSSSEVGGVVVISGFGWLAPDPLWSSNPPPWSPIQLLTTGLVPDNFKHPTTPKPCPGKHLVHNFLTWTWTRILEEEHHRIC